ncbi:MAG: FG-GAP-like repeat-containing protein [Planctomycetota bacterium]|nr:FG-GAP-like repeat-containing protein [Planctomycetota bacterium]
MGDIDGDGDTDAVGANYGAGSVIWTNQGGAQNGTPGHFDATYLAAAYQSEAIELADLDGDGDLDLFQANYLQGNRVWLNQGGRQGGIQGQFSDTFQVLGNFYSRDVSLGDVDGDGDLDAFVANDGQGNRVWLNQADRGSGGVFLDSGQSLGNAYSEAVELGDLDNDGDLDAFVANYNSNRVWLNQGGVQGGTVGQFVENGQTLGALDSSGVRLGDVDNDGDLDAFVTNARNGQRVWINLGQAQDGVAGTFADSGQVLGTGSGQDVALGDVDGDGDLDAFVATGLNQNNGGAPNEVWLNQGGVESGTLGTFADSGQRLGRFIALGVEMADFDSDGDLDVFSAAGGGRGADSSRVWFNLGGDQAGRIAEFASVDQFLGADRSEAVGLGDLDGDGDVDAVIARESGGSQISVNQGGVQGGTTGLFLDGQQLTASRTRDIELGDLDGDGDLDLFFANQFEGNVIWFNQGGAQGGTEGEFAAGQTLGDRQNRAIAVSLGDVDGDGDLDAFVVDSEYQASSRIWVNQGGRQGGASGLFLDSGQSIVNLSATDVALGDLDGDGDLDAFVTDRQYLGNRVWLNQGGVQGGVQGSFVDSGQELGSRQNWYSDGVDLGDVDGDGDLDAFVANSDRYGNRVLINQGGAQGGTPGVFVDGGQRLGVQPSRDVALADLDGDGDLDAFVINSDDAIRVGDEYVYGNRIWINQGGRQEGVLGTFADSGQALSIYTINYDSENIALGDVDGDGDLDALVANDYSSARVWLNGGITTRRQVESTTLDVREDGAGVPTFRWRRIASAANYQVYVTRVGDGVALNQARISGTTLTPEKAWPNGTYRAEIRGFTADRRALLWSDRVTFVIDQSETPLARVSVDATGRPTITWSEVPDAVSYQLYVTQNGRGKVLNVRANGTEFTPDTAWAVGKYRAEIRGFDANNRPLTWSNRPTLEITRSEVAQLDVNVSGTGVPTWTWSDVADAERYQLYVARIGDGRVLNTSVSDTRYTANQSWLPGRYRAEVRGFDSENRPFGWSGIVSFEIEAGLLPPSTSPKPGVVSGPRPTLEWHASVGATSYEIYLKHTGGDGIAPLGKIVQQRGIETTSYVHDEDLSRGNYFFEIRAYGDGRSAWSRKFTFEVV